MARPAGTLRESRPLTLRRTRWPRKCVWMMVAAYFRAACATRSFPATLAATCCSRAPRPAGVPAAAPAAGPTVNADAEDILLLLGGTRPGTNARANAGCPGPPASPSGGGGSPLHLHLPPARPPRPAIPAPRDCQVTRRRCNSLSVDPATAWTWSTTKEHSGVSGLSRDRGGVEFGGLNPTKAPVDL